MEKSIGKIKTILEDMDGTGTYITLDQEELSKLGLQVGDWVKWVLTDNGEIVIEKATTDEVVQLLP